MKNINKTNKYLNYFENVLLLASTMTGCVLIYAFDSLVSAPIGITSSAVWNNIVHLLQDLKNIIQLQRKKEKAV